VVWQLQSIPGLDDISAASLGVQPVAVATKPVVTVVNDTENGQNVSTTSAANTPASVPDHSTNVQVELTFSLYFRWYSTVFKNNLVSAVFFLLHFAIFSFNDDERSIGCCRRCLCQLLMTFVAANCRWTLCISVILHCDNLGVFFCMWDCVNGTSSSYLCGCVCETSFCYLCGCVCILLIIVAMMSQTFVVILCAVWNCVWLSSQ